MVIKGHYRKDCPNSTGTSPVPDQTSTYKPPTTVTQTLRPSYAVPQSSLVTILEGVSGSKAGQSTIEKEYSANTTKTNSSSCTTHRD